MDKNEIAIANSGNNLVSIQKFREDINNMKMLSGFMSSEQRTQLASLEEQLYKIETQPILFNERFADRGWCAYDSMSLELMEAANMAFETAGIDAGEQVLISYYKTDVKKIAHWIAASSDSFAVRKQHIRTFFDDHFNGRYYASVPLGLIIIDGAVNDFTKSKGFFAEGTSMDAWDCLVGCSDGLSKVQRIMRQGRGKRTTEPINIPYRNGILHGRDLNYANEAVSCKCVALMFAVADWMRMKNTEERRMEKYERGKNPPPLSESLDKLSNAKQIRKELSEWKSQIVVPGENIPVKGAVDEYKAYPYIVELIEMLDSWRTKNYGALADHLKKMFPGKTSDSASISDCRKFFESKLFTDYELLEIEERGASLSKLVLKVKWLYQGAMYESTLTFGCAYMKNDDNKTAAVPWRNNGKWCLIPWDVRELTVPAARIVN